MNVVPFRSPEEAYRAQARQMAAEQSVLGKLGRFGQSYGDTLNDVIGILASGVGEIPAGLAGIASLPFGLDTAADNVRAVRDALTWQPRSGGGEQAQRMLGELFQPVAEAEEALGNFGYDLAGVPGGTIAKTLPTAIAAGLPFVPKGAMANAARAMVPSEMPQVKGFWDDVLPSLQLDAGPKGFDMTPDTPADIKPQKKMGQGGGNPGTLLPVNRGRTRFRGGRERSAYPGIYGDPKEMVKGVDVEPESPWLSELFDTTRSELSQIALNRPSSDPTWLPPASTSGGSGSAAAQRIMTPSNERRLGDVWDAAREYRPDLYQGMTGWYVSDPMYQRMVQLMGPEAAAKEFIRRETLIGQASPGSDVLTEFNRGSRAAYLDKQGRLQEFVDMGGKPSERFQPPRPGQNYPGLYDPWGMDPDMAGLRGHAYHSTSQAPPMMKFTESGDLGQSSKVPSYIQGWLPTDLPMQNHYAVGDAHWARGVGLADVRTNKSYAQNAGLTEMNTLAPWYHQLAQRHGLSGVPAQGLHWGAFSKQTGVDTPVGMPKLEILADLIGKTAQKRGMDPKVLRDQYLMGNASVGAIDPQLLRWLGGTAVGAAAAPVLWEQLQNR